jgi:anthranilate phosphoribosyltransferase
MIFEGAKMVDLLKKLMQGKDLTSEEALHAMTEIMTGQAGEIRTAGFLIALALKGETGEEIEAFARAMRKAAKPWPSREKFDIVDTCGTGGDASSLLNISTIAALVVASMGFKVAKHGNRAVSSPTGSADVLEELGINLEVPPDESVDALKEIGICFLFAPVWHPAMRYAAPVRRALGVRTVFNILGPITNPAPVTHQLMGVYDRRFLAPVARALVGLGRKRACVVHSHDGLDEISIAAPTDYILIDNGQIQSEGTWRPETFGIDSAPIDSLRVADRKESAARIERILRGKGDTVENLMVSVNAGAVISLLREDLSLSEARALVMDHLKSGRAIEILDRWRSFRNNSGSVTSVGS